MVTAVQPAIIISESKSVAAPVEVILNVLVPDSLIVPKSHTPTFSPFGNHSESVSCAPPFPDGLRLSVQSVPTMYIVPLELIVAPEPLITFAVNPFDGYPCQYNAVMSTGVEPCSIVPTVHDTDNKRGS